MFSGGVVEKGYTRNEWVNLNENIVCGFQMTHLDQMKHAEKKNRCGRPLMKATDKKIRKYIMTLRYIGEQATFSIGIAAAKASVEQGDNKSLKVLKISKGLGPKLI